MVIILIEDAFRFGAVYDTEDDDECLLCSSAIVMVENQYDKTARTKIITKLKVHSHSRGVLYVSR